MGTVTTQARARVGLLGNPSDIYGGRGIGFALRELGTRVRLTSLAAGAAGAAGATEAALPNELLEAGWRVFRAAHALSAEHPDFTLEVESDVPFQSGLSGSSAVLIAALRAFALHFERPLARHRMAQLAWLAETRELGLLAGPLDRLVQAHQGLVFMDFAEPFEPGAVEALDPACLPPLLVVWNPAPGAPSGSVHEPVRRRWEAGDAGVRAAMDELASLADEGRVALEIGDRARLCDLVDRNFDLRAGLFSIASSDRRMIDLGRAHGAAAKFCGSGGSVVALPRDGDVEPLRRAYREAGFETLLPTVAEAIP